MNLLIQSPVSASFQKVVGGFNQQLFEKLTPPGVRVDILRFDGCKKGDEVHLTLHQLGKKMSWVSVMTSDLSTEDEWSFVDEGKVLPWPLTRWRHHHRVFKQTENESLIVDDIEYDCALGLAPIIYPVLYLSFSIRPKIYKTYFEIKR